MQIDRMDLAPRVATLRIYPIVILINLLFRMDPIVVVHPILEIATLGMFINAGDDMNASRSAGRLYYGIS